MNKIKKKLGRPFGNIKLRELRSMTWYHAVKSREGSNDCQLDLLFNTAKGEKRRDTADRIKMFEAIRVNKSIPSDGTKGLRNFDLVSRVEDHEKYKGTAAIIRSPFWLLMDDRRIPLNEIREIVVECITRLGLVYESGDYKDDGRSDLEDLVKNSPEVSIEEYFRYQAEGDDGYDNAMAAAFLHLKPTLDYIALLGALAFEAFEAGNMKIASDQVKFFHILLKEFCEQKWLNNVGPMLYQYAVTRLQNVIYSDSLKGLPDYGSMLSNVSGANLGSPASAFLMRHQRLLWRR